MKVNTALSFLCLGAGLWLAHNDERKRTRRILGLLLVVIAGSTLAEYAFHVNLGIDQLVFRDTRTASLSAYPGRMAVSTAICFLLLGLAVAFLGTKKAIVLQRALVGACFVLSLVALCGYLYGVNSLYAISSFSTVAVHTAAGFFAACLAYFLARPDEGIMSIAASDSNSGFLFRTLIPAIIVVPIAIGWVRLVGQRANLYDTSFGVALLVLGNIGCLTVLTIVIGRSMNRLEWERSRADEVRFRHSAIVESSEDAVISKNLDGIIQSWNTAAERILGYTETEAIGQPITILIPTELSDEENKISERLRVGECIRHYETIRITKAGKRIAVSVSVSPIKDSTGRVLGASKILRDITERKLAEETLRKSEERFHLAAQAGKMFAYEWDVATDIIVRSPEAAQILGIDKAAQTTGQQILAQVHPDDRERLTAAVAALSPETPYLQICYRVARSDGAVIWVSRNSRGHFDEQGKMLRVVGMVTDITERKLAEEAVRTSEERLRLAQWAAHIGTYDLNLRTGVDIWTPETEALYGLPPGGFGGTLTAFENLIHPDDRKRITELTGKMMRTGQPAEAEWRVVWPDGSVHWIASRGQVLMDESGKPSRMLGVNIDITERKLAEDKLREYERAVENAEDMIGVIDRQYRFLIANRQYLKMRNLTKEQVVGHFVADVLNKEIFETEVKPKLDECFQGKVVRYEMRFSYPTVGERDLLLSYFPIEGVNGVDRVACILHDITDRKRAEVALLEMNRTLEAQGSLLRSREELLKIFVKNAPAGVAMFDRDMHYLEVSDRWCADYSVDSSQILGRSHYELFPDLPQHWKEMHRRGLVGETLRAEDRWDRENGTKWVRWEIRPWFNTHSVPGGVLIFAEDITHRRETEEALSGMTRKLVEAQEQERARIARELHDDINQRLALLAIELDQLRNERNDLSAEVRGHLQGLQQMTSDISSSVYALSHELYSSIPDSLGVAKGMKSWCKEFGKRHKMEIDFMSHDLPELPQEVSLCLLRVLQEAVHNAAKHSGVKRIEVQLVENSSEIHLIVRDSGRGFDINAAKQGVGMGLTSMQERVRLVGGTIAIESNPMCGTAIRVRVRLTQSTVPKGQQPSKIEPDDPGRGISPKISGTRR